MRSLRLFLLVSLITANFAFGKNQVNKKPARKTNQTESKVIQFRVVYGERTTLFIVSKTRNGGTVEFSNNLGAREIKRISIADYDYLRSQVAKLSGPTNRKEFCMRNFIEVKAKNKELLGCLGDSNKLANDIQAVTNLISVLF